MNLTVLGKYGPYPAMEGATSGYLINYEKTNIMLEFGSGVLSRIQHYINLSDISAIILSHLNSDHISDMFVLRYALLKLQKQGLISRGVLPIKVFAPDSPQLDYAMLRNQNVFELITITDGMRVHIGGIEISFHKMLHGIPSFGALMYTNKKVLAYTGDTSVNDDISTFAMGANMLLANTEILERQKPSNRYSLAVEEAAEIALEAGVEKLLLSHIVPGSDELEMHWNAAAIFPNVEIAQEMTTYEV